MRWLSQLWTQIWLTLVVAAVSLALYASLGRQLIPLIEALRPDIEQQISAAIQQPVSIGSVQGDWHILAPRVTLEDITLGDPETGINIGKISAELDISASAFYQLPVFKRIEVSQVRGHLIEVEPKRWQLAEGWLVGKGEVSQAEAEPTTEAARSDDSSQRPLWLKLLELQQAVVLSDWRVTHDGLDVDDQLEIKQLLWRNRANSHAVEGQIAWGLEELANITVKGTLQGEFWPWKDQNAQFYVAVDPQDWSRWIPGNQQDEFHMTALNTGFQGWGSIVDGDLNSLYGNLQVSELALQTPAQPLELSGGSIQMQAERVENDWHMRVKPLFEQALPFGQLTVSAIKTDGQKGWQFGIPELDLAATANLISDHGLLPQRFLKYVTNIAPRGDAQSVRISLLPGKEQPLNLAVEADLREVSSDSYIGIPAFSDLSAHLQLTPKAGKLTVNDDEFGIFLKGIYADSWRLDNPSGAFYWDIQPNFFRLKAADVTAELQQVALTADVGLRIPASDSDVEANTSVMVGFQQAPASMRKRLVPEILDEATRTWINDAILGGDFSNGAFVLNGRLGSESPDNSNTVQLYLDVANGRLSYLQDWPEVTDIHGRMMLNVPELDVWVDSGKTLGGELIPRSTKVTLRPEQDHTALRVAGRMTGSAAEGLRYFTETPLQQVVNNAFDQWQASGDLGVSMVLHMPLGVENSQPDIQLDTTFSDSKLHIGELDLQLSQLDGLLNYNSQMGITADQLSGNIFGGDFNATIESDPYEGGFNMLLSASGNGQWQNIKQWQPLFLLDPVSGELNYQANFYMRSPLHGGDQLMINSDLIGTVIEMPEPVGKNAELRRPLSMTVTPGNETRINMNYDGLVKTALALDKDGLDRGQVYLGGNDPFLPSDKGVSIRGKIDQELKAEEWWSLWQHLTAVIEQQEAENKTTAANTANSNKSEESGPLNKIDLTIAGVDAWGVDMGPVAIDANQQWNEWKFALDSDLTKGLITLKPGNQPIDLKLDYIHMPAAEAEPAETTSNGESDIKPDPLRALDPADFPAMDMQLTEFYLGSRNFGSWNVSSRPQQHGMDILLHDSNMKGMRIIGDIHWLKQGEQHSTHLDTLQIRGKNVGRILRAFRQKDFVDAEKLRSAIKLSWQGSPLNFNLKTLNGLASLRLEDGTLDTEGADALKAFGALNFDSIQRRLQLDFSDLYQSGVAFDVMKGKAAIEDGLLTLSEPLLVDGPGGKFLMSGATDLTSQQMDMQLAVTFPVTSTLPMVAVLAGLAPPVAAAIYVSEKLVGDELERFTSASYTVQGTWSDPKLEIDQAFNNEVEGKESRSFKDRVLSIFGLGDD